MGIFGKKRPAGVNNKPLDRQTSTVYIYEADNDVTMLDDVVVDGGDLYSAKEHQSIPLPQGGHKIPVLEFAAVGRPTVMKRSVYVLDTEPDTEGGDPAFMFGDLQSTHRRAKSGQGLQPPNWFDRNRKSVLMIAGCACLVVGFVIAPMMGWRLGEAPNQGQTQTQTVEVTPTPSIPIEPAATPIPEPVATPMPEPEPTVRWPYGPPGPNQGE